MEEKNQLQGTQTTTMEQKENVSTSSTKKFNIITDPEILRKPSKDVFDKHEIETVAAELKDVVINGPGAIGIAAVQLGKHLNMFLMVTGLDVHPDITEDQMLIVINPEIKKVYDKTVLYKEGCLSEPDITVLTERYKKIKVKFTTLEGRTITTTFTGTDAVVFQHEYDHLQGILMKDKAVEIFEKEKVEEVQDNTEKVQAEVIPEVVLNSDLILDADIK